MTPSLACPGASAGDRTDGGTPRAREPAGCDGGTRFQHIDNCSLARAAAAGVSPKDRVQADYKGKCGHAACPACGKGMAVRFSLAHENKAAAIFGYPFEVVLTWANVPSHSAGSAECRRFLDAAEQFALWAKATRWLIFVLGLVGFTHFNFVPRTGGNMLQPHVHVAGLDGGPVVALATTVMLTVSRSKWKALSGKDVVVRRAMEEGNLDGFREYARKHPVRLSKREKAPRSVLDQWRRDFHDRVLNRVERERGRPAFVRFVTGVYGGKAFAKLQARARFLLLTTPFDRARSPDRRAPPLPPGVRRVLVKVACPKCRAPERLVIRWGRAGSDSQRCRCKRCGKTFTETGPSVYGGGHVPGTKIPIPDAFRMHRMSKQGATVSAIARATGRCRTTVRKALGYCRRRAARRPVCTPRSDPPTARAAATTAATTDCGRGAGCADGPMVEARAVGQPPRTHARSGPPPARRADGGCSQAGVHGEAGAPAAPSVTVSQPKVLTEVVHHV